MTSIQGGQYVLNSVYDPTVAELEGELWMSYECAGHGFYTASCITPLTGAVGDWSVDISRTTIVVKPPTPDKAASVPKIFRFQGKSYMWFDYFRTDVGYLEARGLEMQRDPAGRYWAAGYSDTMDMDADGGSVCVWSPSGNGSSRIADVFGVAPTPNGRHLIVSAGVGGIGCRSPSSPSEGCYRLAVGRTNFPLGKGLANEVMLGGAGLPGNAMEYAKQILEPRGPVYMAAHYLPPDRYHSMGFPVAGGFQGVVLPRSSARQRLFYGLSSPCDNLSQPYPDWGDRAMRCMRSCGGLGGTSSFDTPCSDHGKEDAGQAYDTAYCCT